MRNVGGISVTGGSYPARIFGQFMNAVLDGTERVEFPESEPTRRGRALRPPYEERGSGSGSRRPSSGGGATTPTTTGGGTAPTTPDTSVPAPTTPPATLPDVGD
jgi:membrane peptidoglycan carboxypeptidase